jgi:hypothetical protein
MDQEVEAGSGRLGINHHNDCATVLAFKDERDSDSEIRKKEIRTRLRGTP